MGVSIERALLLSQFIGLPEGSLPVNHPDYDAPSGYKNSLRFLRGLHWVVERTERGHHHDKIERCVATGELLSARLANGDAFTSTGKVDPTTAYGGSKLLAERLLQRLGYL